MVEKPSERIPHLEVKRTTNAVEEVFPKRVSGIPILWLVRPLARTQATLSGGNLLPWIVAMIQTKWKTAWDMVTQRTPQIQWDLK